jgi:UDPglucose 6-dehydrogenase
LKRVGQITFNYSIGTVPVGTMREIEEILNHELQDDYKKFFTIASMPEFLAEGTAIKNLVHPDRIVIGTPND